MRGIADIMTPLILPHGETRNITTKRYITDLYDYVIGCLIGLGDNEYLADNRTRMPLELANRTYTDISYEDTFVAYDYITDT